MSHGTDTAFVNHDLPATFVPGSFESSNPDISWQPEEHIFIEDPHALYIDYESGNDNNGCDQIGKSMKGIGDEGDRTTHKAHHLVSILL